MYPNPLAKKYGHHAHKKKSSNKSEIKKKLRDAQRLLKKDLNATVRLDTSRKIQALQDTLEQLDQQAKEEKLAQKYKYVKFVELTKVNRKLKQGIEEPYKLYQLYIEYYPKDAKYIALFPKTDEPSGSKEILEKIAAFRDQGLLQPGFEWRLAKPIEKQDKVVEETGDDFFL